MKRSLALSTAYGFFASWFTHVGGSSVVEVRKGPEHSSSNVQHVELHPMEPLPLFTSPSVQRKRSRTFACEGTYAGYNVNATLDTLSDLAEDSIPPPFQDATDVEGAEPYFYTSKASGREFYIRPIFFEALPYLEKECTRVFSWLSTPVGWNETVPATVLVHGGGGTAFNLWCEEWADRDFASIAIAHEGQTDERNPATRWKFHEWGGPYRIGSAYSDSYLPMEEQWMFHAVADTILANSLMKALVEVNYDQVGVTGVSWGGVITATVIGFDSRFAYAIPGYGCGALSDSLGHLGMQISATNDTTKFMYDTVWDPVLRLANVTTPTLWISSPQEFHFPLPDQAETYNALPESAQVMLALIPNLGHSHAKIYNRQESYEFAKSVVKTGEMWARQVDQYRVTLPRRHSNDTDVFVHVMFESTQELKMAKLVSSTGSVGIISSSREWTEEKASVLESASCGDVDEFGDTSCLWSASAILPPGTTSWYFLLCTSWDKKVCISSRYIEDGMDGTEYY